jgi:hypothetical protein
MKMMWDGEAEDIYGGNAVVGTLALLIRALGLAADPGRTQQTAANWWLERHCYMPVQKVV